MAVVRPTTVDLLAAAVKCAAGLGAAVIARGGGMSYTSGYVPAELNSVIVDMSGLNRVVEINEDDGYVIVEAGCTWRALYKELSRRGLRTPFWGTLSGRLATVGGALSQDAIFWGSGSNGRAAENVLGLEIVLADGRLCRTGAWAHGGVTPFVRGYGPDLTGPFLGDCGALGFKSKAVLRLIRQPLAVGYAAYAFADAYDMLATMAAIACEDLASECFAVDPFLLAQRARPQGLAGDLSAIAGAASTGGSFVGRLKAGAKAAIAGRGYLEDGRHALNLIVEGRSPFEVDGKLARIDDLATARGGQSTPDTTPRLQRANPFGALNAVLGPAGERWVPVHAMAPHSEAAPLLTALTQHLAAKAGSMATHDIGCGFLFVTVSTTVTVIEPVFFYPDAMAEIHQVTVEPAHLKQLPGFAPNAEARAVVDSLRAAFIDIFTAHGAAHLQVGKTYPYAHTLSPEAMALLRAIKAEVDPNGRINPGVLGLS